MAGKSETADQLTEFVITRVFDAPRHLVFKMWTEARHLEHWFGPKGSTLHDAKLDLRPGGRLLACMGSADGRKCGAGGSFAKSSLRKESFSSIPFRTRKAASPSIQ